MRIIHSPVWSALFLIIVGAACSASAACSNAGASHTISTVPPILDGKRCFEHVKKVVEIGPRPSGSSGIEKTRNYISDQLKEYGHKPVFDRFSANTARGPIEMFNVRCEIEGDSKFICALVTHYDTKRIFNGHFVGANDGGSGVGVLLEIARYYSTAAEPKRKPPISLRILFVDGEETQKSSEFHKATTDWDTADSLWGSRHEANRLLTTGGIANTKVVIVLDLVGDKNLNILEESQSSRDLVAWFREAAKEGGVEDKFFKTSQPITDDHLPFIQIGVADVIDIIDFDYGKNNSYWHTKEDTLDKLAPESLQIVGDAVLRVLPKAAKKNP
ncbi:MAG: M28 family peptidase [Planctomycetota bacterium]